MLVNSWGRLTAAEHTVIPLNNRKQLVEDTILSQDSALGLAYGMGRSYGDVCLNPGGKLWLARGLDRFIAFDDNRGSLTCEAGVLLKDIQRLMIPRGWMLPVTPGTQMITVGGAIANDVHGKNHHHAGTFGEHVRHFSLLRSDGKMIHCNLQTQPGYFAATVGGLGLTGIIVEVELQLRRIPGPWLTVETIPYTNLGEFFQLADESEAVWEHTVSWIDCTSSGRGIFMRANPIDIDHRAKPKVRCLNVPVVPPISLVNSVTLKAFSAIYYNLKKWNTRQIIMHYEAFFYPLDTLHNWNRLYGPKGFFQYQCVIPRENGPAAIQALLQAIAQSGLGSFLTVLKTFADRQSVGMLSFPQAGVTLAVDFPNQRDRTHKLFQRLDSIVQEARGRLYLAKDARMPRSLFTAAYARQDEFMQYRDPGISSALSRRLLRN